MSHRKIENPEQFRKNIREKLIVFFEKEKDSINLEKGVYNWTVKEATNKKVVKKWDNPFFVQIYIDHLRSIYINLKNDRLIKMVNDGEIKSQDIAFMTHQEICPEKWEELIKAKSIRDKNKFEQNLEAMTDRYTCRKCKSKRCSYYQLQVRSSDEGITTYLTCLDCGQRMKFN
jgi:DNA-directed RNA polymerase subunit M/transcription elongation factor TFIIS